MHTLTAAPNMTQFSFPEPVAPESMTPERSYVLVAHSCIWDMKFIGPFTPILPCENIAGDKLLYKGFSALLGVFGKENGAKKKVMLPNNGRGVFFGLQYALYEFNDSLIQTMKHVSQHQEHIW